MAYLINVDLCNGCGLCIPECPMDAIHKNADVCCIDPDSCTECGSCADICPLEAARGEVREG